jgi:hypothetical protein
MSMTGISPVVLAAGGDEEMAAILSPTMVM